MDMSYEQKPESNGIVRVLLVVGGMAGLCIIIVALGLFFYLIPQQQAQTARVTSTAEAIAHAEATRAARPTLTPRPTRTTAPTFTPRPTRTPVPTIAPTPTLDPALVAYVELYYDVLTNLDSAFVDFIILNDRASRNTALLSDSGWLEEMLRTTTAIEQEGQRIIDYPFVEVPSPFAGFHTKFTEAMVAYRDSMILYREWITTRDSAILPEAQSAFERGNMLIQESNGLLPVLE
jgi:hypothetical protein